MSAPHIVRRIFSLKLSSDELQFENMKVMYAQTLEERSK